MSNEKKLLNYLTTQLDETLCMMQELYHRRDTTSGFLFYDELEFRKNWLNLQISNLNKQ